MNKYATDSLDFTDKQTYLVWRATWREQYKELSHQIRALKAELRQYLKDNPYSVFPYGINAALARSRKEATIQLNIRAFSKEMARGQYIESKKESNTTVTQVTPVEKDKDVLVTTSLFERIMDKIF